MADFASLENLISLLGPDAQIEAGWIQPKDRTREVNRQAERIISEMNRPLASLVVADEGLALDEDYLKTALEDGVFFWEFEEALLNRLLPTWRQLIGDCVSMGSAKVCQDQIVIEAVCSGGFEIFEAEVATEPIYAGSRVEIGGGRLGNSDGSLGVWAQDWVTKFGVLLRKKYGNIDLSTYSGDRAKEWGMRGRGCPDELEPEAKKHPISETSMVTSVDDAIPLLLNLNGITVASNQGFTQKRDREGFCHPSGSWAHQMCYRGACKTKSGKIGIPEQNSWGDYLGREGEVITTYSGREVKLPPGCFLVEAEVANRGLRQQDSFAHSGIRGWRKQTQAVNVLRSHVQSKYSGKARRKTKQGV